MDIYVFSMPYIATGGTELLQQLTNELNSHRGVNARIVYLTDNLEGADLLPRAYQVYGNPMWINRISFGNPRNTVIIVPEPWVTLLEEAAFNSYPYKAIYWESVDNYFAATPKERHMDFLKHTEYLHIVQSEYARLFLKENGIPDNSIIYVSDYLSRGYLEHFNTQYSKSPKVLYNPAKGLEYTKKLIDAAPDIEFVPIKGMTPREAEETMKGSMVYIDFGSHPGKDRMPREAAVCGCVVITGRLGSAANPVDVPIPDDFKYENTEENISRIITAIREVFKNFDEYYHRYDSYRKMIHDEPELFKKSVTSLVKKIVDYFHISHKSNSSEFFKPINAAVLGTGRESITCKFLTEQYYNPFVRSNKPNEDTIAVNWFLCMDNNNSQIELNGAGVLSLMDMTDYFNMGELEIIIIPEPILLREKNLLDEILRTGFPLQSMIIIPEEFINNVSKAEGQEEKLFTEVGQSILA